MQPLTGTLINTRIGIGGAFTGLLVGHLLTRSWQHEQWSRDKRHEDYQAVLSAISSAYMAMIRLDRLKKLALYSKEAVSEVEVTKVDSFRVLRDRIFIADELEEGNVLADWDAAVTNYEATGRMDAAAAERWFAERFSELNGRLVRMALQPPKSIGAFRRWRMRRELARYRAKHLAKH